MLNQPYATDPGWALFRTSVLEKYGVTLDQISTTDLEGFGKAHAIVLDGLVAGEG